MATRGATGHKLTVLRKSRLKYDIRKFYFTNSIVDYWNSLPNWVVVADTNVFKRRLDQYWQHQDIINMTFKHRLKEPEVAVMFLEQMWFNV